MNIKEEIKLLIRAKYPLVYLETVDEDYSFDKIMIAANQLNYMVYEWSSTRGLGAAYRGSKFYDNSTQDPAVMLKRLVDMVVQYPGEPGVYILSDLQKYLDKPVTLRLFKDLLNVVRPLSKSVIILASEYTLPKEIESDCMRLKSGYPDNDEIKDIFDTVVREIKRVEPFIRIEISGEECLQIFKLLKGLSTQQIENVLNRVIRADDQFDIGDIKHIEEFKRKIFDQDGLLEFCRSIQNDEISGFANLKKWLQQRKNVFFPKSQQPSFA